MDQPRPAPRSQGQRRGNYRNNNNPRRNNNNYRRPPISSPSPTESQEGDFEEGQKENTEVRRATSGNTDFETNVTAFPDERNFGSRRNRRGDSGSKSNFSTERSQAGSSRDRRRQNDQPSFDEDNDISSSELRRQLDRLERDLQRRDRELEEERKENEKCMDAIKKLERDKVDLKRELEGVKDEADEYKRTLDDYKYREVHGKGTGKFKGSDESEDAGEDDEGYSGTSFELAMQQKNKELEQLLEDNEKLEEEKKSLEEKLAEVRDSLGDATKQIESLANDHFGLKSKLQKADERIKQLEEEKIVHEVKQRELIEYKERQEQYLGNLCQAVDVRVDVWKKLMFDKDEEIERLNNKIGTLMSQIPNTQMDGHQTTIHSLNKKILDREHHIALLNEQLANATEEINSNAKVIESLQEKLDYTEDAKKTEELVKSLHTNVKKLEDKVERKTRQISSLEKEAEEKSKSLTSLMARMTAYESGEYGLSEAVSEIKDLKTQIRIRDKQVEGVTQEINVMQMQVSDLQDENEMLRDKLGLETETDVSRETRSYIRSTKNELQALRSKVRHLEEDVVSLKTHNYSLKKQLGQYDAFAQQSAVQGTPSLNIHGMFVPERERDRPDGGSVSSPKAASSDIMGQHQGAGEDFKDKYEQLVEENAALKKGMTEMVECMHKMTDETMELKACISSTLSAKAKFAGPDENANNVVGETLSSTSMPPLASSSSEIGQIGLTKDLQDQECQTDEGYVSETAETGVQTEMTDVSKTVQSVTCQTDSSSVKVEMETKEIQTEHGETISTHELNGKNELLNQLNEEKDSLLKSVADLKVKIEDLESMLRARDEAINEIRLVRAQQEREFLKNQAISSPDPDLQDALAVARETINSLQERLKSKDDNISQYRRLLADARTEMTSSTERHVQEMRALQMTIHQQQQAFTRMKSTLSQPVRDTLNVQGTIKDQLTRIHELEDEISELQHAMSNNAAQLTAARSEAHRWRCQAESKVKEVDSARDQANMERLEELNSVRQELRDTQKLLEDAQSQLTALKSTSARESMTDLVNVLRSELEEKDKQIEAYSKSLHNLKNSANFSDKSQIEERLRAKEAEVAILNAEIKELQKTISSMQVKISKFKAVNYKSGATAEVEELKAKVFQLQELRNKLEKELSSINKKRDEDELKKIKNSESIAKWEESKKWKKTVEKFETRIKELESENDRLKRTSQNLRITITRIEKEKIALESKLNKSSQRSNSYTSGLDRLTSTSESSQISANNQSQHAFALAQGEIAKLRIQIADLQELNEKIEFEGREESEKLKMEVKLLKDRILAQERQLSAYQIAQKGDSKMITEIENMATREAQLQKEIRRLEEDNLHLSLQIEQLKLDTPRLRDRVHHLQRLVDALKTDSTGIGMGASVPTPGSQKSLGELEKTISALKQVIEKLQSENKKLKAKPAGIRTGSTEKLKTSMDALLDEKQCLMDKLHTVENEYGRLSRKYSDATAKISALESQLLEAEKRTKSAEMRLRTFLDNTSSSNATVSKDSKSSYDALIQKMRDMQEELENKTKLLAAAKHSLQAAEKATAPTQKGHSASPRVHKTADTTAEPTPGPSKSATLPKEPHCQGEKLLDDFEFYSLV